MNTDTENEYERLKREREAADIRPVPLYAVLFCALVIVVIGVCLTLQQSVIGGYLPPGRGTGPGFGSINGPSAIVLGLLLALGPLYLLRRKRRSDRGPNE